MTATALPLSTFEQAPGAQAHTRAHKLSVDGLHKHYGEHQVLKGCRCRPAKAT